MHFSISSQLCLVFLNSDTSIWILGWFGLCEIRGFQLDFNNKKVNKHSRTTSEYEILENYAIFLF